ncbi:hypothetical protein P8605_12245 [Streptomyces sp. T-3]|nr:hypothetical protein [Streptomyces sp. T-3]
MNKNVMTRAAGVVCTAVLLLGAGASVAAAADGPKPPKPAKTAKPAKPTATADATALVESNTNVGLDVGALASIGVNNEVNGANADTGAKVNGPAGISTSLSNETNVGLDVDVLADLVAVVGASVT